MIDSGDAAVASPLTYRSPISPLNFILPSHCRDVPRGGDGPEVAVKQPHRGRVGVRAGSQVRYVTLVNDVRVSVVRVRSIASPMSTSHSSLSPLIPVSSHPLLTLMVCATPPFVRSHPLCPHSPIITHSSPTHHYLPSLHPVAYSPSLPLTPHPTPSPPRGPHPCLFSVCLSLRPIESSWGQAASQPPSLTHSHCRARTKRSSSSGYRPSTG